MKKRKIGNKEIKEANLKLDQDEMIMLVSDGVTHAGIGGLLNFGLGWDGIAYHFKDIIKEYESSSKIAERVINLCEAYYCMEPGDDTTAVVVKFREERGVTLFSGPPKDDNQDESAVNKLISSTGKKVVCGGTTAQIVARELEVKLKVEPEYHDPDVPPISHIKGIDLVTEGLLTLNKAVERINNVNCKEDLPDQKDGATQLAKMLLDSDIIRLLVGRRINSAHQSLKLPENMAIRKQIIKRLINSLEKKGKHIKVEWF